MTGKHGVVGADSTQVLGAVRTAVNEASAALRALRELCDRTEAAARNEPLPFRDSVAVFEARMELVEQVRALLPPVEGEVKAVNDDFRDDREYPGGTDSGN